MKWTFLFAAVLALAASAAPAQDHKIDYKAGFLEISHPWTRATPKGASVAGGYLKITNKGTAADRLVGATSAVAPRVEIHEMAMTGGMMRMRALPKGLEIKPGETVEFKPGSYHIMFMNLKQPLEKGQRIKGTLVFEKAGPIEVEYAVEAVGAQMPDMGARGH
jgi:copper(I)-binding protein